MKPRFLLDEHVNRAIQRQLRRLDSQIEVLAIGDPEAPPTGTLDPEILVWLESHGYLFDHGELQYHAWTLRGTSRGRPPHPRHHLAPPRYESRPHHRGVISNL